MNQLLELSPKPIVNRATDTNPVWTVVNPLEVPDWDELLQTHHDYSFFHGRAWARVLHEVCAGEPRYLVLLDHERLRALVPIMAVSGWLQGRRGSSLPFSDECPPLLSPGVPDPLAAVLDLGEESGWHYWECRGSAPFLQDHPSSIAYYGHRLDLAADPVAPEVTRGMDDKTAISLVTAMATTPAAANVLADVRRRMPDEKDERVPLLTSGATLATRAAENRIFHRFHPSVRRCIRKGLRSGLEIEIGSSPESLAAFYGLYCLTRREHGLPPQPFSFFQAIQEHVLQPGHGFIVLARSNGRPVAAAVYFQLGGKVLFKFGASDRRFQSLRPNNVVMWTAIRSMIQDGASELRFGRTSVYNLGLRRFKTHWGAQEYAMSYYKYDYGDQQFVKDKDRTRGWYNRIFRSMPVPLSRSVGALAYGHTA